MSWTLPDMLTPMRSVQWKFMPEPQWQTAPADRIKAIEYYPNGLIKRIEYHPEPVDVTPKVTC